jgi:cell division protein FtsB
VNISAELVSGVLVAVVGGGGLWAYLGQKGKTKADLITIAQDAAGRVIQTLQHEIERLNERIEELEAQDERCRAELADIKRRLG